MGPLPAIPGNHWKSWPGFTLLELIVVIALISILTGLAVPRLSSSLLYDDLKTSARKLVGIIAEAGQEAIRNRTVYVLDIDMEKNIIQAAPELEKKNEEKIGEEVTHSQKITIKIPESVQIVDVSSVYGGKRSLGQTSLRFSPKGYVDKTYIHLRSEEGNDMTVMVSPFLGVIKIADLYVDLEK